MDKRVIAHVRRREDGTWAEPQSLEDHLEGTAALASRFAAAFDSAAWGRAAALCHDAGKARPEWQSYIRAGSGYDEEAHLEAKRGKVDHSTPGAALAVEVLGKGAGRILSYCVAGHHGGLPDWIGGSGALASRLQEAKTADVSERWMRLIAACAPGNPPWKFDPSGLDLSLWIRMLFSCLVDADFLDTESYMDGEKSELRGGYLPLDELLQRFDAHMSSLTAALPPGEADSPINSARRRVLADCRSAARLEPGFFSLTVPTGGGKTLSSMAFALAHAVRHGKDRVIYVIPYTSIIEQNADVFRSAVGADQVVEHHSNLDEADSTPRSRLAAENWDAPVIVTTAVQFFESLFAAKTSRCRKLHNIANSVVVLDEAQLLPPEYLGPIIAAMKLLSEHYGTSFVVCTATQPILERRDDFPKFPGLPAGAIREIVGDVETLYQVLRRVEVVVPSDLKVPTTWESLAEKLSDEDRVLCIVSDRRSCRELHALMPEGTYHLSALMCAQHRSDRIAEIKECLKTDGAVRVVSTQLVEAGVDIDFPVVYRAMAGLDSIAQAAGRCNREGRLAVEGRLGRVVIFVPPRKAPVGLLRKASETAERMLESGIPDPLSHAIFAPYFSELYWKANSLDAKDIIDKLRPEAPDMGIQFREAADACHLIDDGAQRTVLVPYREGEKLIQQLKAIGPERWLLRKLQRYAVNVYTEQFVALQRRGSLEVVSPELFALNNSVEYNEDLGLLVDELPHDPASFIA